MFVVKKFLHEKRKLISTPTTIHDLKEEINNLKNHPMYKEFLNFMQSKEGKHNIPQSYSTVLTDKENIEIFDQNDKKEVILLLEQSDLRWRDEPWQIMHRYLDSVYYTTPSYKYMMHYEMILLATGFGEFQHFYPVNT
ncbi:hypothetical protein H5410_060474 [Solanum commersonii]|uniref:Uncharacterized protein n=1 Tax=Solanum commersonii TaxID=4109 RepID=A0A9J5W640_SOLCO|nr:hypothetical protein H5410_060474 [Solanum commersonii]